jgi:RNA polymerase sigma factor (sigma-70 family)
MLDTLSGSSAHPAVNLSEAALLFRPGKSHYPYDRLQADRRVDDRRTGDRRSNSFTLLPPGFVERRKVDRRLEDRRSQSTPASIDREALYKEFQPLVRRLIRQYGDCPEVRQDLAGEIYYRFSALLDAYDPGRGVPLKPYLVRQLSASVYTYARHGWIRQRREVSYEQTAAFCEPVREDPTREWDNRLAMDQVLHTLPDAISSLPRRQRQVVVWRYYEQRSFDEIAVMLNVKTATARSLLRHGVNNLRKSVRAKLN